MAIAFRRSSKIWIYLPLYLIFLVGSVYWLYWYLQPAPKVVIKQPVPQAIVEEQPVEPDWISCFENYQAYMEGVLSITPGDKLATVAETVSADCMMSFCDDMVAVSSGSLRILEFYASCKRDLACRAKVLAGAEQYHRAQLQEFDVFPLFYNAGQNQLTSEQKRDLLLFLNIFRKKATELGLLIIGRASATGSREENKQLSRVRAENILSQITGAGMNGLESDFVYFGADPPQLTKNDANLLQFDENAYRNIRFGGGSDHDFAIRLNQSVLLIMYDKDKNPFGLL